MVVNKAYDYCKRRIDDERTGIYVRKQMKEFMDMCEGKHPKYTLNEDILFTINEIYKKTYLPNYSAAQGGRRPSFYEGLNGFQWLAIIPLFCIVHRDNPLLRRYNFSLLEAGRQVGKTTLNAGIILLEFMLREPNCNFYSVSYDEKRAKLVVDALKAILKVSPELEYKDKYHRIKRFTTTATEVRMDHLGLKLTALPSSVRANDTSSKDSYANVFTIVDEVGMFDSDYAVTALIKGQTRKTNALCSVLSTRHRGNGSHYFEKLIKRGKDILDGKTVVSPEIDESFFSLLYEPDEPSKWRSSTVGLYQANPAMLDDKIVEANKLKARSEALNASEEEAAYYEHLTKDCNIPCDAGNVNSLVSMSDVKACIVPKIDWTGREVVIGVDLSEKDDNSAVIMGDADISKYITLLDHTFIPEFCREKKERVEHEPYSEHIKAGFCTATTGSKVINYQEIVDYICGLEDKYGCKILAIGYDPNKAGQLVEALDERGFTTIAASHTANNRAKALNRLLYMMRSRACRFVHSDLLLNNFANARINYKGQEALNPWFDKKHAAGKVDIVAASIYMIQTAMAVRDNYRPTVGVVASVPRRYRY